MTSGGQMMIQRTTGFLCWLLAGLWIATPAAAQEEVAEEILDQLKKQTVKITVTQSGRPVEFGSGVVLCQETKQVYVLTAHHVLAGKSDQAERKNTLRLRRIEKVEISFFGNSPPPVGKDALTVFQVPGEDLLLLSFSLEQVLPRATVDRAAVVDEATEEEDRPVVAAIGYWKDKAESWALRQGTLLPGGGKLVHHSGDIAEGFSGGPLFNETGSLIGINIERVSGEAIGADAGSWYGEALAIDQILPAIDKWVPSKCLKSASPLSELAYLTYRKAMQAVSIKRWDQAEELMRQAIEQQPIEGGSVHLEGLRYTPYLPLYHHGLAHYKLAGKAEDSLRAAEHYSTAIRAWERSEAQGEIQRDKRHRSLERLMAKSYKALQRESTPQTEREKEAWAAVRKKTQEEKAAKETARRAKVEAEAAAAAEQAEAETAAEVAAKEAWRQEVAEVAIAAVAEARAAEARAAEAQAHRKAEAESTHEPRRVVTTDLPCALLRTEPALTASRLRCLRSGIAATLLDERDDWSRIRLRDETEGWMASRLLEQVGSTEQD